MFSSVVNLNENFNLKFQQTIAISCENQQVKSIARCNITEKYVTRWVRISLILATSLRSEFSGCIWKYRVTGLPYLCLGDLMKKTM